MATMTGNGFIAKAEEEYNKLITQLDLAYRENNAEEIKRIESQLEIALDKLDAVMRAQQSQSENRFYLGE